MIARIWHGWTKPADAKAYENMLRDEIFPGIAARKIAGYHGAELFVHEDGDEVEFSEGFGDLHTRVYEEVLAGRGFGIDDSRAAIDVSHRIRTAPAAPVAGHLHPSLTGAAS